MMNLNRLMFAGNLTADPARRGEDNGSPVNISLACNRRWKDKDGTPKEEATFIDCEAWGKTADTIMNFCKKGRNVYIEGRLKNNRWETSDGQKRQRIVVVIDSMQFIDSPKDTAVVEHAPVPAPVPAAAEDEAPF
jgi:single-strand DNA-binding protein